MRTASPFAIIPALLAIWTTSDLLATPAPGVAPVPPATAQTEEESTAPFEPLRWRHIGPPGNRAIAVAGEPGDPKVMYVGAASGGLWRTLNGLAWEPVFDEQNAASIGAVAVALSAPNEIWVGTGETFYIRPFTSPGDGVYKSTDRGSTWTHVGLEETGRVARVVVHSLDPNVVYVCALGDAHRPQRERGVFKTTDGGATWKQVLFVNEDTGCSDLNADPGNPQKLFAGMWQVDIKPWNLSSGGPGSGVYLTRDGGETWNKLAGGLPTHDVGKTSVDVARSNPNRVYALIEDVDPSLYRSDDGGKTWTLVNNSHHMLERPGYYTRLRVAPDDADRVYFQSVAWSMSRDAGETVERPSPRAGGDIHDMWIDPLIPERLLIADDQGLSFSWDKGGSWERVNLPIAQMYHIDTDTRVPYYVYSNRQDGPSFMAPSNTRMGGFFGTGGHTEGDWRNYGGCESGHGTVDKVTNRYAWSGCYDGGLNVIDLERMQPRDVEVWPESAIGWAPKDIKERFHWSFPIAISPHDNRKVYVGSQRVHVTTDMGNRFDVISPDLTRAQESHMQDSGGVSTDNLQTFDGAVLYTIEESPVEAGVIWTGSNDGLVQVTRDGGGSWSNVTPNMSGIPEWAWIKEIHPSRHAGGKAYVAVDDHLQGNTAAYLFRTTDYGSSWTRIDAGIPKSVFSYVHTIHEDPVRPGLLYAGTENQVWVSFDDGETWSSLRSNMPPAPAYGLQVQEHFNDLVLATYGRGIWILDDVTPLQQLTDEVRSSDVHLFEPRATYRFHNVEPRAAAPGSELRGANPPYGAAINYWLGSEPEGSVGIEILDDSGTLVRKLEGSKKVGVNRVWWDLRHEDRKDPVLRTVPPGKEWVEVDEKDGREPITWGSGFENGPKAVPGTFTVRLTVGDVQQSRQLEVRKDPHSEGTLADIREQVTLSLRMQEEFNHLVEAVDKMEWIRKQNEVLMRSLEGSDVADALGPRVDVITEGLIGIESRFIDVQLTGGREDSFRSPMRLYGRYIELMRELDGTADYPPTVQQRQVADALRDRLQEAIDAMNQFLETDLEQLRELVRQQNLDVTIR
ncbi:MAG TPA: glycosyl hydrolase [Vicinamibacteria bacterium]|nr:glycosyl hydrolase [Vicinamibacteria bacterium]